jgi:hypothetical protein
MTTRVQALWAGLMLTATLAFLLLLPTAIEYAVMLGGVTFNAID